MERSSRIDLGVIALLALMAALYLGRIVLMPLALALLVTFALAPLVRRLEHRGLGRYTAVIAVCLMLGAAIAGVGWLVAREASELASSYPSYRTHLREKIEALRGPLGSVSGAAAEVADLGQAIEPKPARSAPKVEVVERPHLLGPLSDLLASLVVPLATVGLVAVLAVFMLLEREELRDRLIWLTGTRDLSLTTQALDEAAQRVSGYLGMQSLICALHGIAVATGLLIIGVPGAVLWGALAATLRFLPYFGPWVAAALPTAVSLAAFQGWTQPLSTVGLFIALELLSNNVLEPWLYGAKAGLSPFGVIFSAVFWAGLWGVPGLLLATPLTVCLVVAGRYVRALEYFPVLLGNQPALAPDVRLYQRLLALDRIEAAAVLKDSIDRGESLEELSDRVVLPVLRRLAEDARRDALSEDRSAELHRCFEELLDEVAPPKVTVRGGALAGTRVLFAPALDDSDSLAGRWLARLAESNGAETAFASPDALASEIVGRVEAEDPDALCVSALTRRAASHARHLGKRLETAGGGCEVLIGRWAAPPHELEERPANGARCSWITTAAELDAALHSVRARRGANAATERAQA
jgi:predicted PurR-regulated permease PerM